MLYSLLRLPLPDVGELAGTVLALLGLGWLLRNGAGIRNSLPVWLLLAAILVQLISWTLGTRNHPEWMTDHPKLDRLAKHFLFLGIAWWLGGSTRNTFIILGLGLLGLLLITLGTNSAWQDWMRGFLGHRVDFGIHNAQHTSLFFGAGLVGLVVFAKRVLTLKKWWWLGTGLWLAALLVVLSGVAVTQTRATWFALVVALPVMLLIWMGVLHRQGRLRLANRAIIVTLVAIALVLMSAGTLFQDTVAKRLNDEQQIIDIVIEGDFRNVPYSSIGNRVLSWAAAAEWIAERPIVGWGAEGRSLVMKHTDWLPEPSKAYGHLHNSLLELIVSYGVLGLGVFVALAVWVARGTWLAWRAGVMPDDVALFGVGFFVFWCIVNMFESFLFFWSGVYLYNLVMGGLVTHIWRWQWLQRYPMKDPM
ncbi:O-antigen ligase family protein [Litchfieldella xinjiangensis]|uniref:O-antigen ligase family protein n=1 Tax=Litchfieldella xinjiangensis TaxID=1166948 RepID=UPI0005B937E1|nr:O-antigen ligase family protein [Halomonas xinjiangensis]